MGRLVHHELRASLTALLAFVVSAVVVALVREFPPVRTDGRFALHIAGWLALWVLFTLLKATRIKWLGEVRDFDAATPVDPETVLPTEEFWPSRPIIWGFLPVLLVPTLVMALAWEPWVVLILLWLALDWTAKAARIVHWERKNRYVLWRGGVRSRPWELSYSPVRPPAPARTATDAPPR
jgi:hypothetical protein